MNMNCGAVMKTKKMLQYVVVIAFVAACAAADAVVVKDFARYSIIIERRPFGEAPSEDSAIDIRPPPPSGPSFADSLQLCAFTECEGTIRVGFVDSNSQKTYFLFVGESEDGIEVESADYENETVLLSKGGVQCELRMGGVGGGSLSQTSSSTGARNRSGFSARRRRARRTPEEIEEERRLAIERKSPILQGEEYEAHIRRYNMELIRQGGAMGVPLPITLTQEEDAQLVGEGVLAPPEPGIE